MIKYELMYILVTELDEEATKEAIEKVNGIIEQKGGSVVEVNQWGKKRLAYPIEKKNEGYYVVTEFEGNKEIVDELDRVIKIDDNMLRHLIVKAA
ncbi:30S ribosomal protein S6 [Proteinivorax tanatarense]|uniref:Small ribosomal subunit protein bS6 n=1 Tax=Proteinivorax tanatarense TaxID=1260629 RepID=A0AAU7VLQ2_9FIRM